MTPGRPDDQVGRRWHQAILGALRTGGRHTPACRAAGEGASVARRDAPMHSDCPWCQTVLAAIRDEP